MLLQPMSGYGVCSSCIDVRNLPYAPTSIAEVSASLPQRLTYFEEGTPIHLDFSTYGVPVSSLMTGYKLDGYISEDGDVLSWDAFNALARDAAEAYAQKTGWESFNEFATVNYCDEGLHIITGLPVKCMYDNPPEGYVSPYPNHEGAYTSRVVTWEELDMKSWIRDNDGYSFILHPYIGQVKIDGSGQDAVNDAIHKALAVTDSWEAANGPDPDFSDKYKNLFSFVYSYGTLAQYSVRPKTDGYTFVSTDDVIKAYLELYDDIWEEKMEDLAFLQEFYSRDAILERARKAGYTDPEELERIVAFQSTEGDKFCKGYQAIKDLRTYLDPLRSQEENLAFYLSSYWNFNQLLTAFGWGEVNGFNTEEVTAEYNDFIKSIAHAALAGEGPIQMKGFTLSYEQFLEAEQGMTQIDINLSRCFLSPAPNPSKLLESQRNDAIKLAEALGGVAGHRVMEWFDGRVREFVRMVEEFENSLGRPGYYGSLVAGYRYDALA